MAKSNLALQQQVEEGLRRSPEIQAEIERIGMSDPYIETQRDLELHQCLDEHLDSRVCLRVQSAKGAGLPKALQHYRMKYVKRRGVLQQIPTPVVYVKVQQPGRPIDLLIAVAEALAHDLRFPPLRDLRSRVWGTLKAYGVKLLIIDNAEYLSLEAFNELVEIFDNRKIPVVLAGTYHLDEILGRPKYGRIYNSFLDFHDFRPLNKAETTSVMQVWEEAVWVGVPLNLATRQGVATLLHERTEGLVDPLYETLRKIAIAKIDGQIFEIEPLLLSKFLGSRSKPKVKAK
jgi:AAA domain